MNMQPPAYTLHKLVIELDKVADSLLQQNFGLSYKRFYFLLTLKHRGTVTQHELAVALGYSDPAVSNMVQSLAKSDYITVEQSALHGRKRMVSLTEHGAKLTTQCEDLLNERFDVFVQQSGINIHEYANQTEQLLLTIYSSR